MKNERATRLYEDLLPRLKENLILDHSEDDDLLRGMIRAAVSYAEGFQHREDGFYTRKPMRPTTEQAVIMLASHYYESRDGATGGFFADTPVAADQSMRAIHDLLRMDREVWI